MLAAFSSPWDHPRSCGAHPPAAINITGNSGSSPRMRGSLRDTDKIALHQGIIPAHAGLTACFSLARPSIRDHPRACGAHLLHIITVYEQEGSSPRMRGSPIASPSFIHTPGIIPAHAGLTPSRQNWRRPSRDHPRACGAHLIQHLVAKYASGSSPRMRGSPSMRLGPSPAPGIIPAHAGLTDLISMIGGLGRDHPRACGAHARCQLDNARRKGSSPRMRGSPATWRGQSTREGIIPAHAGLTSCRYCRPSPARDHPRACGAHEYLVHKTADDEGSSPRMRGSL